MQWTQDTLKQKQNTSEEKPPSSNYGFYSDEEEVEQPEEFDQEDSDQESIGSIQNYDVIKELGRGATAVVQLGRKKSSLEDDPDRFVALKVYNTSLLKRMREVKRVGRRMVVSTAFDKVNIEIAIMKKLNHPHLISLKQVLDDEEETLVLMLEYAPHGQVMQWEHTTKSYQANPKLLRHESSGGLDEEEARRCLRELLLGLEYLHQNNICHRDLKPENILLSENGVCKIADFGVAHIFEEQKEQGNLLIDKAKKGFLTSTAGTYAFMGPETINGNAYCAFKADLWALGVTFYALLFGKIPFYDEDVIELFDQIENKLLFFPEDVVISDSLRDLMEQLLKKDPEKRCSLEEIKHHPWVLEGLDQMAIQEFLKHEACEQVQVTEQDIAQAVTKVTSLNVMVRIKLGTNKWKRKALKTLESKKKEQFLQQEQSQDINNTRKNVVQVDNQMDI
jgi:[calcium/calmodulin-dependent protein kinase] kinase